MFDPTGHWKQHLKQGIRRRLNPRQVQNLKSAVSHLREAQLWARSAWKEALNRDDHVQNVYHACVQKTGSQWINAVFRDQRIRRASGLEPFPQFRYEWGEFREKFPTYTYVPGLYISRGLYEEIEKPDRYRTIYVLRDPRNIVVSWYHSMRESHRLMGKVFDHRRALQELDFDEGLAYCIKAFQLKFSFMRSWAYARDDDHTLFIRLEELGAAPVDGFLNIMEHCGISIERPTLEEVLTDYTKEKMRERDLAVRDGDTSHYREESTDWRDAFTERHRQLFREVTGNLVDLLGYEE